MVIFCRYCGVRIEIESGRVGTSVICPTCNNEIKVPDILKPSTIDNPQKNPVNLINQVSLKKKIAQYDKDIGILKRDLRKIEERLKVEKEKLSRATMIILVWLFVSFFFLLY
jgi:hypothetical protein